MRDVLVDGGEQFGYVGEYASTQAFDRDVAKEALHQVQPRSRGRREVHVNARAFGKPPLYGRMLVGGIVVGDQMQCLGRGRLPLGLPQELQPLEVAMPLLTLGDDLTVEDVERREQRGRAVALVVMRHRRRTALLHWQPWLGAIQRFYLALLVAAQHLRVLGRGPVQADDVLESLHEARFARDLEAPNSMRLEPVLTPNPQYCGVAYTHLCDHRACAPLRGVRRQGLRRQSHDLRHVGLHGSPATRQISLNRRQSALNIPIAPASDLNTANAHLGGNRTVVQPVRCTQHDLRATRQSNTDRLGSSQLQQLRTFRVQQHNVRRFAHRSLPIDSLNGKAGSTQIGSIKYEALH